LITIYYLVGNYLIKTLNIIRKRVGVKFLIKSNRYELMSIRSFRIIEQIIVKKAGNKR